MFKIIIIILLIHLINGVTNDDAYIFLKTFMPYSDRLDPNINNDIFLNNTIKYALLTRNKTLWNKLIPNEIFLNDVLPYTIVNEPRDDWRKLFYLSICQDDTIINSKNSSQVIEIINTIGWNIVNPSIHFQAAPPNKINKISPFQIMHEHVNIYIF